MKVALILLVVVAAAVAQVQRQEPAVTILKQFREDNADGSYSWAYQNSDGSEAEQKGYLRNPGTENEIQVMEGSYTYYDSEGLLIKVRYIADENGFQILEDTRSAPAATRGGPAPVRRN